MKFSEKLKEARGRLFLTQAEMAKLMQVTEQTIRRWEHDLSEPRSCSIRRFNDICKKYKLKL